ncbi:AAA domain-containing protein [Methanimicrococcus hacksteinii]|uniref:AAA domain-containing protein n=1 Tax=Methanimicrococcus hacksteinii TaxID=3028293 RepID=UPI00298EF37F|nr:AAA domain-containing protein [Methanimicrococcus sp. At1]
MHLVKQTVIELKMYIDSIEVSTVLDGTYCPVNQSLVDDIQNNPARYKDLFGHIPNLKILNYLSDCNRLDGVLQKFEHALIPRLDSDRFRDGDYRLDDEQYSSVIRHFQSTANEKKPIGNLALNVISIHSKDGLYVLGYRRLYFNVIEKTLFPSNEITFCSEFTVNGTVQSIQRYLDEENLDLLNDIEPNLEMIKDCIAQRYPGKPVVDDIPYMIAIDTNYIVNLEKEYQGIIEMYQKESPTIPIRAFFGELTKRPVRRKSYPLALIDKKVNMDQLLAISKAMKYPLAYIQGPPGTGKTYTIVNTIITAFYNNRTVLFTSYNNHPIDGVFESVSQLKYKNISIKLPIIRLGNKQKVNEAIDYIRVLYEHTDTEYVNFENTNSRNRNEENTNQLLDSPSQTDLAKKLNGLLETYEEIRDLNERLETIDDLLAEVSQKHFESVMKVHQKRIMEKLELLGNIPVEEALTYLPEDSDDLMKYLKNISEKYIKRLHEPKYKRLIEIVYSEKNDDRVAEFNKYLSNDENFKNFLRIFPVVATTCLSARRLGKPKQYFDMVIIDEASQCNTAVSLIPIIRGENLTLVGDPQQLNPVILLDRQNNAILKNKYNISQEYDYIENSIYKTYLACDSVSDEILLSNHYRCDSKIIEFNNKKYYNNKLNLMKKESISNALMYVDVKSTAVSVKNSSREEAETIVDFIKANPQKKIGIITPFVNQRKLIADKLLAEGLNGIPCGTVHAFQGDEKDVILFSLALTDQTSQKTYDWLKNSKELINVATSRAKEQLIVISDDVILNRLHAGTTDDDIYELVNYVKTNGVSKVTEKSPSSRALGIKPYSTDTEEMFLQTLSHALDNIPVHSGKYSVKKEVSIAHVFNKGEIVNDLFFTGRFDFVIYEKRNDGEWPVFAIELDGKEHVENEIVQKRDRKKEKICKEHGFPLIRVENSYARRYNNIKDVLIDYFTKR